MKNQNPYRRGERGRSITSHAGIGSVTVIAHLQCTTCPKAGDFSMRAILPPAEIDRKFRQRGWSIDPHRCPDCLASHRKEKASVSAKPTPAAMRAQALTISLLSEHFDPNKGVYAKDWSDKRIATETGLAPDLVVEYRRECFGELKEPDEVRALRDDINAVETLQREQHAALNQSIAELRANLAKVSARWAA